MDKVKIEGGGWKTCVHSSRNVCVMFLHCYVVSDGGSLVIDTAFKESQALPVGDPGTAYHLQS